MGPLKIHCAANSGRHLRSLGPHLAIGQRLPPDLNAPLIGPQETRASNYI